jgi:hypothetical protein
MMTTGSVERGWGMAFAVVFMLLLMDVAAIALKSRKAREEPAIQDVFLKEKPQFTAELGQLLTIVPPTDYDAPPPELHGPQYRTADWLKAQGAGAWTLQVLVSPDEEIVKEYLAKRADREQYAYFAQKREAEIVYVVVFGSFVTRELAIGEATTMDFGMTQGVPAPAKFTDYIAQVPVFEPAIDAPPTSYGDVPEPVAPGADPVTTEPPAPTASGSPGSPAAGAPVRQETFDPFATTP